MAVFLSPIGNGAQYFTIGGLPANGGFLKTYQAGTTTPQATFTTSAGNVANPVSIPLGVDGRPPAGIWLTSGIAYDFILTDSSGAQVGPPMLNITGIGDGGAVAANLAASSGSSLVGWIQSGTGAVTRLVQDKLRERVSILDFGADPTGVADSAAAFTKAGSVASKVEVHITAGTYLLNSNPAPTGDVTWVIHAGVTLTGSGTPQGRIIRYAGPQGPILIQNNPNGATNPVGMVAGLYTHIGNNPTATPAAGDTVAHTITVNNINSRTNLVGIDIVMAQDPSGADGIIRGIENEIANVKGFNSNPYDGQATPGFRKNAYEAVMMSGSTFKGTAAFMAWANDVTGAGWWNEGIALSRVFQYGVHAYKNPGGASDLVLPFQGAFLFDESDSANVLKVNGAHASIIDLSNLTTLTNFVKMSSAANQTLPFKNSADFNIAIKIDPGNTAAQTATIEFADRGTAKWQLIKAVNGDFNFFNAANGSSALLFNPTGLNQVWLYVDGALRNVVRGAADSGGVGYTLLRTLN